MSDYFEELKKLYLELGDDISVSEVNVDKELNQIGLIPADIQKHFLSMIQKWEGIKVDDNYIRKKIIRSLTTLPIVESVTKKRAPRELKSLLILLDAMINSTDDIIDTKYTDKTDIVSNAIVIHFGNVLSQKILFKFIERPHHIDSAWKGILDKMTLGSIRRASKIEGFPSIMYSYLLNISQIPSVESQTHDKIIDPDSSQEEMVAESVKNYVWRGRDIDIYWDLPSIWLKINENSPKIKELIRAYRSIELLDKDRIDLRYDLHQGTKTPLTALAWKYGQNSFEGDRLRNRVGQKLVSSYNEFGKNLGNKQILSILNSKIESLF